jgi:hypothetical protein
MSEMSQDYRRRLKRARATAAAVAVASLIGVLGVSAQANENCGGGKSFGNNGWGNGEDGENPGSFSGGGVSRGGPGENSSQSDSKPDGGGR